MITKNSIQAKWKFIILFTFLALNGVAQEDIKVTFKKSQFNSKSPFQSYVGGSQSAPSFGDLDNDGDLDLVVGYQFYQVCLENDNGHFLNGLPDKANRIKPFSSFPSTRNQYRLAFGDLNGDNKTDGVCVKDGKLYYVKPGLDKNYRNRLGGLISGTGYPSMYQVPSMVDMNADGKLDIISRYENGHAATGSLSFIPNETKQNGALKFGVELEIMEVTEELFAPAFADLDLDGDLDIVFGSHDGEFHYFKNIGTEDGPVYHEYKPTNPENPFFGFDVGDGAYPSFFDVDGDGDLDLFSGATDGAIHFFENTTDEFCSAPVDEDLRWKVLNTGNFNGSIQTMATDVDGNVYVGGEFTTIGGIDVKNLGVAKWDKLSDKWINIMPNPPASLKTATCSKIIYDPSDSTIYFTLNWCNEYGCVGSVMKLDANDKIDYLYTEVLSGQWFNNKATDIAVNKGNVYVTYGDVDNTKMSTSDGLLMWWPANEIIPDTLYSDSTRAFQSVALDEKGKVYFTDVKFNNSETLNGSFYQYNSGKNVKIKEQDDIYSHFKASLGPQNKWIYEYGVTKKQVRVTMDNNWLKRYGLLNFSSSFKSVPLATVGDELYVVYNSNKAQLQLDYYAPSTKYLPSIVELYNNTTYKSVAPVYNLLHLDNDKNLYSVIGLKNPNGSITTRVVKNQSIPCAKNKQEQYTIEKSFAKLDQPCDALITDNSGNLYAGGKFTSISNNTQTLNCNRIAKWDVSDKKWSSLGKGTDGNVEALALDPNGNLVVGGSFNQVDGKQIKNIAVWDQKNESWSSIGKGYEIPVQCKTIAFDSEGMLYIGGGEKDGAGYVSYWNKKYWVSLPEESHWKKGWSVENIVFDRNGDLLIEVHGKYTPTGGTVAKESTAVMKWLTKEKKYAKELLFLNGVADQFPGPFITDDCDNRVLSMEIEKPVKYSDLYLLLPNATVKKKDSKMITHNGAVQLVLFGGYFYGISSQGFFRYKMHSNRKIAIVKNESNVYQALAGNPHDGFYTSVNSKSSVYTLDRIVQK